MANIWRVENGYNKTASNMMEIFFEQIRTYWITLQAGQLPTLGVWNYIILAVLVAIEGPIVTLVGAAAASAGLMQPELVFLAASAGNLTADVLWYSLGYAGKIEWLYRYGNFFGVRSAELERLKGGMYEHAAKILFLAKLAGALTIPALVTAGLARAPIRRWLPALVMGDTIWTGSLVLIGFYATQAIARVQKGIEYLGLGVGLLVIFFVVVWFMRRFLNRDRNLQEIREVMEHKDFGN
jgi:membrane protein DedA with SNARE-associated domain